MSKKSPSSSDHSRLLEALAKLVRVVGAGAGRVLEPGRVVDELARPGC